MENIAKYDELTEINNFQHFGNTIITLQNSDPNVLFNDIHGKGTGWCTAGGLETATAHLKGGKNCSKPRYRLGKDYFFLGFSSIKVLEE